MFSKRELEGYLRCEGGAGIAPEQAHAAGNDTMPIGRGMMLESPTITCSHCQAIVVLNPDRSRSRGWCPKCDKYVCDLCEAARVRTGICRPFSQLIDEFFDSIAKGTPWHGELSR